jgi:hypothetical protein
MAGTATQPPRAVGYPGLPEERMPASMVSTIAVEMALAAPRTRLRRRCPSQAAGPDHMAWRLRMRPR